MSHMQTSAASNIEEIQDPVRAEDRRLLLYLRRNKKDEDGGLGLQTKGPTFERHDIISGKS